MQFLADVFVPCDVCEGKRFKPQVLEVKYRGRSVDQVLEMTVREALGFFSTLAQGAAPAAGARRDRPRLPPSRSAGHDAVGRRGPAHQDRGAPVDPDGRSHPLYPGRADHGPALRRHREAARGVQKLLQAGHSLLVIEHNLDVVKTADWIIDLGPEGGEEGGRVVATGTPEQIIRVPSGTRANTFVPSWPPAGRTPTRIGSSSARSSVGLYKLHIVVPNRPPCATMGALPRATHETFSLVVSLYPVPTLAGAQPLRFDDVVRNLRNPDPKTRLSAVKLLREAKYPEAIGPIAPLVNDPIDDIQLEAITTELSFFIGEEVKARRMIGFVVERRNPAVAATAFDLVRPPSCRDPFRPSSFLA